LSLHLSKQHVMKTYWGSGGMAQEGCKGNCVHENLSHDSRSSEKNRTQELPKKECRSFNHGVPVLTVCQMSRLFIKC